MTSGSNGSGWFLGSGKLAHNFLAIFFHKQKIQTFISNIYVIFLPSLLQDENSQFLFHLSTSSAVGQNPLSFSRGVSYPWCSGERCGTADIRRPGRQRAQGCHPVTQVQPKLHLVWLGTWGWGFGKDDAHHKVLIYIYKATQCMSSRRNLDSSNPSPTSEYALPPGPRVGGGTLACGSGGGGVPIPIPTTGEKA